MRQILTAAAVLVLTVLPGQATQVVKLRGGIRLEVDRADREQDGYWLYSPSGILHVAARDVVSIEEVVPPGAEPAGKPRPAQPRVERRSRDQHPTRRMIDEAAWRHGLPPAIVHAVAQAESAYNQRAVSHAGAIGVMQLMPGTAAQLGANPRNEAENIDAGTRYLREMLVKFQHHPDQVALAIAAYNAGPGAVDRYRGVPPYQETRTYVRRVIGKYEKMATPFATVANQEAAPEVVAPQPVQAAMVDSVPVPQVDKPTVSGLDN